MYGVDRVVKNAEDLEFLIEEVKKASPLGMSLSTHTLRKLVHFLASNSPTLPRGNDTTSTDLSQKEVTLKKPS